jgi:hypothetical protein
MIGINLVLIILLLDRPLDVTNEIVCAYRTSYAYPQLRKIQKADNNKYF